jgi:50S ribosomal protein L16 3-hydroxylase
VSPDAFLELATRPDAATRLIVEEGGAYPWELMEGPFDPDELDPVPGDVWSMLIQEMDRMDPAVHALWKHVSFLPNWRLDDIMVSLASPGGGVGAHIDNYDVFLLQGHGRRRWQIGLSPVDEEVLIPDLDVSILADFSPDAEWILEPGDMLYLPPRFAHYGVALDSCMTFSFGCRAPSPVELTGALLEQAMNALDPELRYSDPGLKAATIPGLLDDAPLAYARGLLADVAAAADRTLGMVLSEPRRYAELDAGPDLTPRELRARLSAGERLYGLAPYQVMHRRSPDGDVLWLFVRGECVELHMSMEPFARALSSVDGAGADDVPDDPDLLDTLVDLVAEHMLLLR